MVGASDTLLTALSLRMAALQSMQAILTSLRPPSDDQRGSPFVRVFSGRIDIGSFEAQPRHPTPHPAPDSAALEQTSPTA